VLIVSNLKKKDIIRNLSKNTGFSFNLSKKLIEDFLEILVSNIKKNDLKMKNIGTFKLLLKKERIGRNPKTKKEIIIKQRKSVSFTVSKNLSDLLNKRN
jgi:nucleoid DNA-binding protein